MITITYFWLKSKIYFKKVIITANNTFAQFIVFINVISLTHQSYHNLYDESMRKVNTTGFISLKNMQFSNKVFMK